MAKDQTNSTQLLGDAEIQILIDKKHLILENFDKSQLSGCCYEFRVGDVSYSYDYENKTTRQSVADTHTINPFETLTIITMEKVELDFSQFLILFSKGSLFSVGLTPVSTAADPGFRGYLGITMTNLSTRPIEFKKGDGFVKGYFLNMGQNVSKHYVGQHGDAKMSWPYPSQFHTEPEDFTLMDAKCWSSLPPPIRNITSKIVKVERNINLLLYIFITLVFVNVGWISVKGFIPTALSENLDKIINYIGSFASIIGLILSVYMFKKN